MLRKPRLRFAQLDNEQLEEACAVLDAHCIVKSPGQCSDVQVGWRLLTVNGRAVCRPQDALSFPVKRNKAWVKFGEPEAANISITKEERATARFFRQLFLLQEEVPIPLIDRAGPITEWQQLMPTQAGKALGWEDGGCLMASHCILQTSSGFPFHCGKRNCQSGLLRKRKIYRA